MKLETLRTHGLVAVCAVVLFGTGASAWAQQPRTYEGDIVAIDGKANTFTVKATKPGEVAEMAFHVSPGSELMIGGTRVILGELVRGDHVTVTYETAGSTHTVRTAHRVKTASKEMTFTGTISTIDLKAQTFAVKGTLKGEAQEMVFHFQPGTKLYVGGEEEHFLPQLRQGESVTVTYETVNPTTHNVKLVKKAPTS